MLTALKACCDQKNLLWPQDILICTMSWVLKPTVRGVGGGGEALTSPCLRIWLPVGLVERGNHAAPALCHPDEPPARPSPCGDPCTGTWAAARGENSTCEPAPTGTAISLGGVGWGEEEVGEEPEFKGLRRITDLFTLCL